jgi:hypothetical protein
MHSSGKTGAHLRLTANPTMGRKEATSNFETGTMMAQQ